MPGKERTKHLAEILNILTEYKGTGVLLFLYLAALVCLLIREKDGTVKALFGWLPFTVLVLFMLPPVYRLYSKVESDTYYRLLWMIPMGTTIIYTVIRLFGKHTRAAFAVLCALFVLGGTYTYSNVNITKASNRLHLPYQTVDICNFLLQDSGGKNIKAAFPGILAQSVRQYTSRIDMPFGREMTVSKWEYWNEVYEVMEKPETVDAAALVKATRDTGCNYLVISSLRKVDGKFEDSGLVCLGTMDGFLIYRDPEVPISF